MRQTVITAATTALVTAMVAIWGTTVIIAHSQKGPATAATADSIDVMEMMKKAKNLPEEKYDAY